MRLISKLKITPLLLSSVFLISCDSSTPLPFGGSLITDVTEADETVTTNELFEFNNILLPENGVTNAQLRVGAVDNILAGSNGSDFTYSRTGLQTATLESPTDTETLLNTAVQQVFSVNNAANVEITTLLLVTDRSDDAPELSSDQIDRLIEILNVNGANLRRGNDSDEILGSAFARYTLTVTSSQQERAGGLVSGTYGFEDSTQNILFDTQTFSDNEGNSFLFFIPVVSPIVNPFEKFEQGTFTLQLNNEIGF